MTSSAGKHDLGKVEAQGNVSDTVNIVSDIVADSSLAPAEEELEYVPDGGKEAWTVVLGSTLALFASSGLANSYVRLLLFSYLPLPLIETTFCRVLSRITTSPHFSHLHRHHP